MLLLNSTFYQIGAKYRMNENMKLLDEPVEEEGDITNPFEQEEVSERDIGLLKTYLAALELLNDKLERHLKVLDREIADLEVIKKFVIKITSDE